ncbi:hypothetical protein JW859_09010 [bacterium]|nr:hypothetical protein [bacterium]
MCDELIEKYKALSSRMRDWIMPVIKAHRRRDKAAAQAALDEALAGAAAAGLDEDELAAVRLNVLYLDYHSVRQIDSDTWQRPYFEELSAKLQQPQPGPLSESARLTRLLMLQVEAERDGLIEFSPEQFEELFGQIDPRMINPALYHFIGSWAFEHRQPECLATALEQLTASGGQTMSDYLWHRLHLMHRLLQGVAEKRDVQEMLQWISHPYNLTEFEHTLLEPCRRAGLIDAEIEKELKRKADVLKYTDSGLV